MKVTISSVLCCFALLAGLVNAQDYSNKQTELKGQQLVLDIYTQSEKYPLNQLHSWKVKITDLNGAPVTGLENKIDGGMEAHKHGLPTKPVMSEMSDGWYLLEGIKFQMTGLWFVRFDLKGEKGIKDSIKYEFDINH